MNDSMTTHSWILFVPVLIVKQLHCQTLATVTTAASLCKGIYPRYDTEKVVIERTKKIIVIIVEDTILKIFDLQGT